jgi:hypothetical protein
MMLPSINWLSGTYSDDLGDAHGRIIKIEWLGFIVDIALYRRGRR